MNGFDTIIFIAFLVVTINSFILLYSNKKQNEKILYLEKKIQKLYDQIGLDFKGNKG